MAAHTVPQHSAHIQSNKIYALSMDFKYKHQTLNIIIIIIWQFCKIIFSRGLLFFSMHLSFFSLPLLNYVTFYSLLQFYCFSFSNLASFFHQFYGKFLSKFIRIFFKNCCCFHVCSKISIFTINYLGFTVIFM